MKASTAFFLLLGSLNYLVDAKCYLPDGSAATNPQWGVCSEDASNPLSSICCALNRTNPAGGKASSGATADICLPNGLCQNESEDDSGNHKFTYQRAYCTTADWNSGKCLTTCGATGTGFKQMTPCDGSSTSERWCCGSNRDCCNQDNKIEIVTLAAKFGDKVSSSSTSTSTSTSPAATSNNAANTTPTPSSTPVPATSGSPTSATAAGSSQTASGQSTGLTTGAKAGIGIGAVIGCAALVGIGAWTAFASSRRKNAKAASAETPELDGNASQSTSIDSKRQYMASEHTVHEAWAQREAGELHEQTHHMPPVELSGETRVSELGSESRKPEKARY